MTSASPNTLLISAILLAFSVANNLAAPATSSASSPVIEPEIDWGKCKQLAPTDTQKVQKTQIIKACLDENPLNIPNEQLTAKIVEQHRIKLGECALNKENWFNADKTYKYDRAEEELNKKEIESENKTKILEFHNNCKKQATEKFSAKENVIEQVQFYQSCMDYHVTQLCDIKITINEKP